MSEENKALVRRWTEEIWNHGNISIIDAIVSPEYVHHDPQTPDLVGRGALGQHVASHRSAFPDGRFETEDLIASEDKVAQRITFSGTHQADWAGIPRTGKKVRTTGIAILRIADRKVAETWSYWDAAGFMRSLGAISDPAAMAANKAVVRRYLENLHMGDMSLVDEAVSGEVIMHSPHTPEIRSRTALKEYVKGLHAVFSAVRFTFEDVIGEADRVVARWTFAGTHAGEWKGIAPTGKNVEFGGTATYALEGEKIVRIWIDWDALGLLQQLGGDSRPPQTVAHSAA